MKYAALAGLLAVVAGALVLVFQPFSSSPPGSSASRTIYSFAYALSHHNFGRACSYLAQDVRGAKQDCAAGLDANGALNLVMFGADIWAGMKVIPGSAHENKNGSITYKIRSDEIPPVAVRVAKQKSGNWRVVRIG